MLSSTGSRCWTIRPGERRRTDRLQGCATQLCSPAIAPHPDPLPAPSGPLPSSAGDYASVMPGSPGPQPVDDSPATVSPRGAAHARAWLRPLLLLVGGLAVAVLLWMIGQRVPAVGLAIIAVFMGYWTSPLRTGQHTPFAEAMLRRADDHAIILWAPGDPLSARLQTAIRGHRDDVSWVNVYRDGDAEAFCAAAGGLGAVPMVIVGDEIIRRATVGQYLEAREEGERRARSHDASDDQHR